jgi:putative ABC transport system substrate-binding protein
MKKRRKLLFALSAGAVIAPVSVFAQVQTKISRVGFLHVGIDHEPPSYRPLMAGMRQLGYDDGRNILYDYRNATDDADALELARELVRSRVDVIVAFDNEACAAAQKATRTLPIVMINVGNPIAAGFAQSLARPGGNMTGFAGRAELPAKELEFLRDITPKLTRILLLFDGREPASTAWRADARLGAQRLKFTLIERDVANAEGVTRVFDELKPGAAEALMFASPGLRHRHMKHGFTLAQANRILVVASRKDLVEQGALFAYSYDFAKVGQLAAGRYVDRVLKGTLPRDLPVEEVTDYELIVNAGALKRVGLTLPQAVRVRADKVIE